MSAVAALPSRRRRFSSLASVVALALVWTLPSCKTEGETDPPDKTGETGDEALPEQDPLDKALSLLERGHPFGSPLEARERDDLESYLKTL